MKIAIVSSYGVYCGIARYVYFLAKNFLKLRQNVMIFSKTKSENEFYENDLKKIKLKNYRCWRKSSDTSLKKLVKTLSAFKPEIIHVQDIFRRVEGIKAIQQLFPGRIVITLHSVGTKKDQEFLRKTKNYINHFIVHNALSKKTLIRKSRIQENKISVIHHGSILHKQINKKEARSKINFPKKGVLILTYGFFGPEKGIKEVMEVIAKLIKKFPDLYYLHLGRTRLKKIFPEASQKIKKMAQHPKFKGRVKLFWKFLSGKTLRIYLGAADLIVLFYPEKYPLLYSSGIAHQLVGARRPIIVTNVTNFSEFPVRTLHKIPYNKETLYREIQSLLEDKSLQRRLIIRSLDYAKKTSWFNTAKRHLKAYRKTLSTI